MPKAKVRRQIVLGLSYLIDCMRMRHFYASWCINRNADGGRELPAKNVQQLLGHSSIVITMDTYGHLFPASNDRDAGRCGAGRRGRVLINRPAMSAFGKTGDRADIAE